MKERIVVCNACGRRVTCFPRDHDGNGFSYPQATMTCNCGYRITCHAEWHDTDDHAKIDAETIARLEKQVKDLREERDRALKVIQWFIRRIGEEPTTASITWSLP